MIGCDSHFLAMTLRADMKDQRLNVSAPNLYRQSHTRSMTTHRQSIARSLATPCLLPYSQH